MANEWQPTPCPSAEWLLEILGEWDFTMPAGAFDQITARLDAAAPPAEAPAERGDVSRQDHALELLTIEQLRTRLRNCEAALADRDAQILAAAPAAPAEGCNCPPTLCYGADHCRWEEMRRAGWIQPAPRVTGGREELAALYAAASKGFHVSETCGPDGKYLHVSKFQNMADLHAYEDAWRNAMIAVRDAALQSANGGGDA